MLTVIGILDMLITWAVIVLTGLDIAKSPQYSDLLWALFVSVLWTVSGILSSKLLFWKFRRRKYGFAAIICIDITMYLLFYLVSKWIFNDCITVQIVPLICLVIAELVLYREFRVLVIDKIPVYNDPIVISSSYEPGVESAIHLDYEKPVIDGDILELHKTLMALDIDGISVYLENNRHMLPKDTLIMHSADANDFVQYGPASKRLVLAMSPFNNIRHLNTFLKNANCVLQDGGLLCIYGVTSSIHKQEILRSAPWGISHIMVACDYIWHRVMPKLQVTRWLYMAVTGGRNRSFPRVEVLGRISRAGFEILEDDSREGRLFVMARKASAPITDDKPSYSILIHLKRVGYRGEIISVYKFRTMFAYSEYIQEYAYRCVGLQDGGKLKDDFRINMSGRILRRLWLDELPMILNWLKGELKLVGVRPLSRHYYSLYTPEMQQLRIQAKPGLIPPFYYGKRRPVTLQDVMESERIYTEAYLKAPFRTDWRYLWGSIYTILFRRAHSN